jgi:hypothetical protein
MVICCKYIFGLGKSLGLDFLVKIVIPYCCKHPFVLLVLFLLLL